MPESNKLNLLLTIRLVSSNKVFRRFVYMA
jgi:hypothetical protein